MAIKILYIRPLPPIRSGIGDYADFFQKALTLKSRFSFEIFTEIEEKSITSKGFHRFINIKKEIKRINSEGFFRNYNLVWVELGRHTPFELVLAYLLSKYSRLPLVSTIHDPPYLVKSVIGYFKLPIIRHFGRLKFKIENRIQYIFLKQISVIFTLSEKGKSVIANKYPFIKKKFMLYPM